ncbi:DUF1638 domain-containing protein [Methanolobus sediminis]|uniref:DUF1638 domain-containing protein n=1 Tax=Methanolobus sediminis TaxID=3072978 RepID=A0AA51UJZ3_9EURY|nr:DUF1638 domain-containing protein [Methanolobus sediminis]WMW24937.1 DUF1638 domain-containing protein [Methanolobus sediminis]
MPVLSIVACEMLEDELVYVLSRDSEIKHLFVVENRNSFRFVQKLKSESLRPFTFSSDRLYSIVSESNRRSPDNFMKIFSKIPVFRQICYTFNRKKQQDLTVVVNLLRKDLHSDIDNLQSEVYQNAKEMSKISDGILLFYGKCGYNSEKVQNDLQRLDCPVYFLKDNERNIVDDCVSVALGGNEVYTKTMLLGNGRGAIYATPMWLSSMNETDYISTVSYQNVSKYLSSPMYSLLFKINNQNHKDNNFHRNASEFAKIFDMEIINIDGTMDIAINSYMEAKTSIYEV